MPGPYTSWTATEDDLIRQLYPDGGADACLAVMPNRARAVVRHRAHKLGVISRLGQKMKARMERKPEGGYPWPPLSDLDRIALREWGSVTRTGQLRPIVKVELEAA